MFSYQQLYYYWRCGAVECAIRYWNGEISEEERVEKCDQKWCYLNAFYDRYYNKSHPRYDAVYSDYYKEYNQ